MTDLKYNVLENKLNKTNMVQYGIWSNCSNHCDFCLIEKHYYRNSEQMISYLQEVIDNVKIQDWKNKFSDGISLLGGELYFITDKAVQDKFMELIDTIIDYVLLVSPNPNCKYSTVTNGIYESSFLYKVIDRIVERAGIQYVDVNFSYDLKYRFHSEEARKQCLQNIIDFHKRYNYRIGVQMILTQYLIDKFNSGEFSIAKWQNEIAPGSILEFLYPHKIHTGCVLEDFNFKRNDFIKFMRKLHCENPENFYNFVSSVRHSSVFKYTGLYIDEKGFTHSEPVLSDGKEIINPVCNHSTLYQCYSDSDKCMLCDLNNIIDTIKNNEQF